MRLWLYFEYTLGISKSIYRKLHFSKCISCIDILSLKNNICHSKTLYIFHAFFLFYVFQLYFHAWVLRSRDKKGITCYLCCCLIFELLSSTVLPIWAQSFFINFWNQKVTYFSLIYLEVSWLMQLLYNIN